MRFPRHIQAYLEQSPYGPFTEREITWLAGRLARFYMHANEEDVERELLARRAALDPTPRNLAIFNNAITRRQKAKGAHLLVVVCPCGSRDVHCDVDGPDPMQLICDDCGAPVSYDYIRKAIDAKLREAGEELRKASEGLRKQALHLLN